MEVVVLDSTASTASAARAAGVEGWGHRGHGLVVRVHVAVAIAAAVRKCALQIVLGRGVGCERELGRVSVLVAYHPS